MAKKPEPGMTVALDVGTSRVRALVGQWMPGGLLEILSISSKPCIGLRRGAVIDIDATVQAISGAVAEAEAMANCEIHSAYISISGTHIQSLNSNGVVAVRDNEVRREDVDKVLEAAKAVALPAKQVLHASPQEFILDGQDGIRDPTGMCGVRLEAKVHIVTGNMSAAQNLRRCVEHANLSVDQIILSHVAAAEAVLTEDERELGVCLVDIGAGITDLVVYKDGAIRHTATIPVAGYLVTNDIAITLRTPPQHAEELKLRYGSAAPDLVVTDESIVVPDLADRPGREVQHRQLAHIIEPRYEELLDLAYAEVAQADLLKGLTAGIVLTGGGAKMEGVLGLAERRFRLPVRLGTPLQTAGLHEVAHDPALATIVGLAMVGRRAMEVVAGGEGAAKSSVSLFSRMRGWFLGNA